MFRMHRMFHDTWRENQFPKGELKYIILDLIREKPRHGYEIIRTFEERSHGFYTPSPGAVYPTLQFLEEMGYVTASPHDGKKIYTITDEGRAFLDTQEHLMEGIKRHVKEWWGHKNNKDMHETMSEVGRIGRLLGRRFRKIENDKKKRIRDVVFNACSEIEKILEE